MKKIAILFFSLLVNYNALAEDILQVKPFHTEANIDNADENMTFSIWMNNTKEYTALQFKMYLPEGLDVYTAPKFDNIELNEDRFEGTIKKGVFIPDADVSCDKSVGGYYIVTLYDSDLQTIKGYGGEIMQIYFTTAAGMQSGVYPIYLKDIVLTVSAREAVRIADATSYVVIGNPTNQSLTMKGEIPSFVNEKLATETSITNLDLSAVTAVNGTFTYVDGRAVTAPADENVKAEHVAYTRTIGDGKYGSFKAPFAVSGCSNFYKFKNLEANYVNFTETNDIVAGDDLLATGVIDLSADNVALTNVPAPHTVNDVYFFYSEDGKFYHGNNITINPFRTFWTIGSTNSNLMMAIDGELTGIEFNTIDGQNNSSYDLQGRRNENARHGIFVTNGKKQIIK